MHRRQFNQSAVAAALTSLLSLTPFDAVARMDRATIERVQARWRRFIVAGAQIAESTAAVELSNTAWREQVGNAAYHILFKEGTEPPFSSHLNDEKRDGLFVCAACRLPLFTSEMKYDSKTGWPSFFTRIPDHIATKRDFKLLLPRTEYHCVKCGGHQGHVFKDGPAPTHERWCNNGLALRFLAKT